MKELVFKYLKQPSTWRGLTVLLGALGVAVLPGQIEAIGLAVASILGAVETFRNEHNA